MIIVEIMGGLGNQMFQYALGRYLAEKNKTGLKLDMSEYVEGNIRKYELGIFNIIEEFATQEEIEKLKYKQDNFFESFIKEIKGKKHKKLSKNFIREKHFHFDPEILKLQDNIYLEGHWQSEKYFNEISEVIEKEFTVKTEFSGKNKEFAEQITSCNSVSLHIRRGDYIKDAAIKAIYYINLDEYYKNAINLITEKVQNPHFYVFSDDTEWAKDSFGDNKNFSMVDINSADTGYEDMRLMSLCKHNITANSSFSWWAAWLNNNNEKIVITPRKWFNTSDRDIKDLLPESWIKL